LNTFDVVVAAFFAAFVSPDAALVKPVVTDFAAFVTPVVTAPAAFVTPVVAVVIAEFATLAAFVTPAVAAPRILFFEPSVALLERFFEREFSVLVGPLLKREIRLLF
jgi:hypothetical protein